MSSETILGNIRYAVADHNISPEHGSRSCKILLRRHRNTSAFKKLAELILDISEKTCYDDTAEYPNDGVAWNYQTCSEFGYTVTTTSPNQPFNVTKNWIEEEIESCIDSFGEDMEVHKRGVERINRLYGSTHLKVTKVLSVHGTHDPWHKLGLYQQTSEEAPVILIPGTAHCADQVNADDEPPQLTHAKNKARNIMIKWLK